MIKSNISNWAVAVILAANSLTWIIPSIGSPLAIIMILALIFLIYSNGIKIITPKVIIMVSFCLLFFLEAYFFQIFQHPFLNKYLMEFLVLGVGGMLSAQASFSPLRVLRYIGLLSIVVIPFLLKIDFSFGDETDYGFWMGISYGCVKYVIALILLSLFIRQDNRKLQILYLISLIVYLSVFMSMASRGAILAIIFSVVIFCIINKEYKLSKFIILTCTGILLIVVFWDPIISAFLNLFKTFGIHFYALEKIVTMEKFGDLSNGRSNIINDAVSYFVEAPVLGNGVAIYEYYNNRYVHNVFVQLLIEGGLLLFSVICWYIVKAFRLMFSTSLSKGQRYFIAFLIGSGFIELLFSNYLWRSQSFWFIIGYSMRLQLAHQTHNHIKELS